MLHRSGAIRAMLVMGALLTMGGGCSPRYSVRETTVRRDHVRARMITETGSLAPGMPARLAVLFEIDSGWHLFGPMRNDSGLPIQLTPSAPAGFTFGAPLWPAPERLISEGGILDHVYQRRVAVILPLAVPAGARPGQVVTLRCHADWLVCGTACVPGNADLEIALPIHEGGTRARLSPDAPILRESLARVPIASADGTDGITQDWSAGAWSIRVPDASRLAFYPDERCAPLADPIRGAVSSDDRLQLRLARDADRDARIVGVLEVTRPEGTKSFLRVDAARPSAGISGTWIPMGKER